MNNDSSAFLAAYESLVPASTQAGSKGPAGLLDAWRSLVDECAEGYSFGVDEFKNDVHVRDTIETLCMDPRVKDDPARDEFYARVLEADERFKDLVRPDVHIDSPDLPWWRRAVLKNGGDEYVEDMRSQYGIEVSPA
ncbi:MULTISPECIES: hypothetical protein [Actinomadura]|uniref:Uncharacterized protein n=1 Tax=Actinomadura yumaensis TaxID=111807 RepID=A0ABW2CGR6_9ACTN|nr:hypothetical protein [Actinomadura sp. J1-007]MWK34498.1 hypothetical protein [Actinomadura sp. J1-007]